MVTQQLKHQLSFGGFSMNNILRALTFLLFTTAIIIPTSLPKEGKIIEYTHNDLPEGIFIERTSDFYTGRNIKKFIEPVVKINFELLTDQGYTSYASGTGFSVKFDRSNNVSYIVTNSHICDLKNMELIRGVPSRFTYQNNHTTISNQDTLPSGHLYVLDQDEENDLCLMISDSYITPAKVAGADYNIRQMERVRIVGAPNGIYPIIIDSYVSNLISKRIINSNSTSATPLILISSIIFGGQSGSPIFNSNGEVIGVIFVNLNNEQGPIYGAAGIHLKDLRNFLNKNKVEI